MLEKPIKELRDYVRADYARDILRANSDKPLEERWRLVLASEEHQRRRLFARTRGKFLLLASLPMFALSLVFVLIAGTDAQAHIVIASHDVTDAAVIFGLVAYLTVALVLAWRSGNKAAQRKWSTRDAQETTGTH